MESYKKGLHRALRDLRARAEAAKREAWQASGDKKRNRPWTTRALEEEVRDSGLPGAEEFRNQRATDWAPADITRFKLPQADSDDTVLALVHVWSDWAGESAREKWWRNQLDLAREEASGARMRANSDTTDETPELDDFPSVTSVGPGALEVHAAVDDQSADRSLSPTLTPYLARPHDELLNQSISAALRGGPSTLVVLLGDSSTGKTRALYEALRRNAPNRPLKRPSTARDLLVAIRGGALEPGSILWLNETQRFLCDPAGEQAAAELKRHLEQHPGTLALGTLWIDPYWRELTQQGVNGDPHAHARALLTGGRTRRINVPTALTSAEQSEWARLAQETDDVRLTRALTAAHANGHVVQHLTGGPELVTAYRQGPGSHFTPDEHAVITAALDARRMGLRAPLAAAMLAEAADGYLAAHHRPAEPNWYEHVLRSLTTGRRADGSRSDIRCALTPFDALRDRSGAPAEYVPTDYLEQHVRTEREDQLGPPELWLALATHTQDPNDLYVLADEAWRRRLHKHSILLSTRAVAAGHTHAASTMLGHLAISGSPSELQDEASRWAAQHAPLTDAHGLSMLIDQLKGSPEALDALLNRNPIPQLDVTNPSALANLLRVLSEIGATPEIARLLDRIVVTDLDLTHTAATARLLVMLWQLSAQKLHSELAQRVTAELAVSTQRRRRTWGRPLQADLTETEFLLRHLADIGDTKTLRVLSERVAATIDVTRAKDTAQGLRLFRVFGTQTARQVLMDRHLTRSVDLRDPFLPDLLEALRSGGERSALQELLNRQPEAHTDLRDGATTLWMLTELRECAAHEAVTTLAKRASSDFHLYDASMALLLHEMSRCGQPAAAARNALITRIVSHGPALAHQLEAVLGPGLPANDPSRKALIDRAVEHADTADLKEIVLLARRLKEVHHLDAAQRLVRRVRTDSLDLNDSGAPYLLQELHELGVYDRIEAVLRRNPAGAVNVNDPVHAANWITALTDVAAHAQARRLASRAAEQARVDYHPGDYLTSALSRIDGDQQDRYLQRLLNGGFVPTDSSEPLGRELNGNSAFPWSWTSISLPT